MSSIRVTTAMLAYALDLPLGAHLSTAEVVEVGGVACLEFQLSIDSGSTAETMFGEHELYALQYEEHAGGMSLVSAIPVPTPESISL